MLRLPSWAVIGRIATPSRRLKTWDKLGRTVYGFVQLVDEEKVYIEVWKKGRRPMLEHTVTYVLWWKDILNPEGPSFWHPDDWKSEPDSFSGEWVEQLGLPGVDSGL